MTRRRAVLLAVLTLLAIVYFLGPKVEVDPTVELPELPDLPDNLDSYIAQGERQTDGLKLGTEKQIRWAHDDKRKTHLSIVYLHGFSASRQEMAPLSADLANDLGANVFYTRLRGHGRTSDALGAAHATEWIQDAAEALAIGQKIGDRVILVGCSTGATLATHLAATVKDAPIHAMVFVSPNFGAATFGSSLAAGPWGHLITQIAAGNTYGWEPHNKEQARYWTNHFSTRVLPEVAALVSLVKSHDLGAVKVPALFFYSENDMVVDAGEILGAFDALGSANKRIIHVQDSDNPSQHVLAGRIVSPKSHDHVVVETLEFLHSLTARATR